MKKVLIGLVAVLAAAVLFLPKVIGSRGAKAFDEAIHKEVIAALPGAVVETEKLEEGWFSSESRHHIKLDGDALRGQMSGMEDDDDDSEDGSTAQGFDLVIDSKIHHGPIALSALGSRGGSFLPLAAVSESTFVLKSADDTVEVPGTLFSQVNLGGSSGKAIYVVDKYQKQIKNAMVELADVDMEFDINDDGNTVEAEGKSGTLSVTDDKGSVMLLSGASFSADLDKKHGIWLGRSDFDLAQASFTDQRGNSFSFKNASFRGDSSGDAEAFTTTQKVKVDEFVGADTKVEELTMDYAFENIDTQAIMRLQELSKGDPATDAEAMMNELKAIVERSPKFNINELSFKTPDGKVAADLHFSLPEQVNMNGFPYALMQQVQGDGAVRIEEAVMPKLEQLSSGMSTQLEQQGFLAKEGGQYVAKLKLQNGQFTVNDKPLR